MALGKPVTVRRIGEPDAAIRMRHEIVRRVQPFAIEAVGDHRHRAVMFPADNSAEEILGRAAGPGSRIVAVAVVGRFAQRADASVFPQQAELRVALHVAEYGGPVPRSTTQAFAPAEAGGDAVDRGDAKQVLLERGIDHDDVGIGKISGGAR